MAPWQTRLQAAWNGRGPLACALLPVAWVYGSLVALRALAYRSGWLASWRAPVPVWVVGNVVAGGAGKTPTTIALVQHLQARGVRVGVVSRGVGRVGHACHEVRAEDAAKHSGDEPLLIQRATSVPVFVARQRAEAVRALLAAYPATQLVLCDDGLQHLALQRDLEIVVFDERGVGNGWLLPAGPLREPWRDRFGGEKSLVLHTGTQARWSTGFRATRRLADHALRSDGSRVPIESLRDTRLHALAGIARPEAFFTMLRAVGFTLVHCEPLPDHYDFDSWKAPSDAGIAVICTEKDAVKLWRVAPKALAVPLVLDLEPAFLGAIDAALARTLPQAPQR